ncbi:MAG: DUF4124 domain-containing protein [Shewanella sp.]|nr:DUF4124 domain-containing protein [Shewanella sp.]
MRLVILGLLLLITVVAQAAIYKWTDKDGKVHYSDTPITGAEVITPSENTLNKIAPPNAVSKPTSESEAVNNGYQVQIVSPSDQASIRVNNGNFDVKARVSPKLSDLHKLLLMIDGNKQGEPQSHGQFSLTNVDRGEHVFVVKLMSPTGKMLAQSQPTTVYVQRFSKNFKNN